MRIFTIQWDIHTLSVMMLSLIFVQLLQQKFIFHLLGNIEGRVWGLPVTSSMTSSPWKYFFLYNLGRSFKIWCQIEASLNISKIFKMTKFLGCSELFRRKCHRKLRTLSGKPIACPTFWAFDRRSSLKIDVVMAILKFDLFLDLVT